MDISLSFSFPRHLQNYGPDEETITGRENNRLETKRNREGVKRKERWGEEEEITITGWVYWNVTTFESRMSTVRGSMWRHTKINSGKFPTLSPSEKWRWRRQRRPIQGSLRLYLIPKRDHTITRAYNTKGSTVISFSLKRFYKRSLALE